jgi:hypothetical protein
VIARSSEAPAVPAVTPYAAAKVGADLGDTHLAEVPTATVAQFIGAIVDDEGPVHVDEVKRRVLDAIQARSGSKRDAAIEEAVTSAASRGIVRRRGDFLWPRKDGPVVPRDRSGLTDASRRLDYVCDEECLAALDRVVKDAHGCDGDEAAVQAIRLLGVKRNDESIARLKALYPATRA